VAVPVDVDGIGLGLGDAAAMKPVIAEVQDVLEASARLALSRDLSLW
jgi:hypothetical protein